MIDLFIKAADLRCDFYLFKFGVGRPKMDLRTSPFPLDLDLVDQGFSPLSTSPSPALTRNHFRYDRASVEHLMSSTGHSGRAATSRHRSNSDPAWALGVNNENSSRKRKVS